MNFRLTIVMVLWYSSITMDILHSYQHGIRGMPNDRELCVNLSIGQMAKINDPVINREVK